MSHIHILRHGQALHNVDRQYTFTDPPLTALGEQQASLVRIEALPDLIVISPMTRTIQTAMIVFRDFSDCEVQIWPDLREAFDATCNKGVAKALLSAKFPHLDLTECHEQWDYEAHTHDGATARGERVRSRLQKLSKYRHIYVITHRCFAAYLVQGPRFDVCEMRSYRFAALSDPAATATADGVVDAAPAETMQHLDKTAEKDRHVPVQRYSTNVDNGQMQDFGPSLLVPLFAKQ